MSSWIVLAALFFAAIVYLTRYRNIAQSASICSSIRNAKAARETLKQSDLRSRAKPNERLMRTFYIDNSFTTSDETRHHDFLEQVKDLLHATDDDRARLTEKVNDSFNNTWFKVEPGSDINLVMVVQTLTFNIVLARFFPDADMSGMHERVHAISSGINSLWMQSKDIGSTSERNFTLARLKLRVGMVEPSSFEREKQKLFENLNDIFPGKMVPGVHNPLNIILPAYETLWRVALRCFVEVRFRSSPEMLANYIGLFDNFMGFPKVTPLNESEFVGLNVTHVVKEALRLYPPTRRIYRYTEAGTLAVDVEAMQRDCGVWGADAGVFRPKRWTDGRCEKGERREAYMPFGAGEFKCPARAAVAPMMIALSVGTLMAAFGKNWVLIEEADGKEVVFEKGGPLCNGRMAMKAWRLVDIKG